MLLFQVNRLKSTTLAKNLTRQENGDHGVSFELPVLQKNQRELPLFRSSFDTFFFGISKDITNFCCRLRCRGDLFQLHQGRLFRTQAVSIHVELELHLEWRLDHPTSCIGLSGVSINGSIPIAGWFITEDPSKNRDAPPLRPFLVRTIFNDPRGRNPEARTFNAFEPGLLSFSNGLGSSFDVFPRHVFGASGN